MAFDWREYLNVARLLQARNTTGQLQEAAYRSAVSRAYYAAFCHARNYARDHMGFVPSRSVGDHSLVRTHFVKAGRAGVATSLDELRQWRNACDYADRPSRYLDQMVRHAIREAEDVIGMLE